MATLNISKTIGAMIDDFYNRLIDPESIRKVLTFDTDAIANRLKICKGCDQFDTSGIVLTCKSCNCPVSAKVLWPHAGCPEGKWELPPDGGEPPSPPDNLIHAEPLQGESAINTT